MIQYLREIIRTPLVECCQGEEEAEQQFTTPRLRRTGTCFCLYCDHRWGDIIQGLSRDRVCRACRVMIEKKAIEVQARYKQVWLKLLEKYDCVLHELIQNVK
jgi:hypothetical protein